MIPAGDFVLNASLVLGRLACHVDRGGRSHWNMQRLCFTGVPEPHLIRYIKEGHYGETPRSLFFRDGGGRRRNLYAI